MADLTLSRLIGTLKNTFRVGKVTFDASGLSVNRSLTIPDKAGTLAVTADIASYLVVTVRAGTTVNVAVANGYLVITLRSMATTNVPVY